MKVGVGCTAAGGAGWRYEGRGLLRRGLKLVQGQAVCVPRLGIGVGVGWGCELLKEVRNGSLCFEESLGTVRNCGCLESGPAVSADMPG